ncbi:hypothetical protein [Amycolatopsis sp. NPDC051372]|uniref:hypothetical protein n=1 Tax=Amycolatopsis sp. NPDC051372 TaxID=3155669 RepID=UPI00343B6D3F
MTQGAPANILDIDALLVERSTDPVVARLGGRDWTIRRDLTAEEVIDFWKLSDTETAKSWALLLGSETDGQELHDTLTALPAPVYVNVSRQIIRAAGLSIDDADVSARGGSGNSKAS